jgi:hypothetical protein
MKYPKSCLTEAETVERAIAGESLSRFGDGEFNLALGRNCQSQWANPKLAAELRQILLQAPKGCLPCLPYPFPASPKRANWLKFEKYDLQLGKQQFGSAFITRPDSSPWIDTAEYWDRVTDFWRGKDVTLVLGSMRSLKPDALPEAPERARDLGHLSGRLRRREDAAERRAQPSERAALHRRAHGSRRHAQPYRSAVPGRHRYRHGRTLAERGVHAVDLGHIGLFMRRPAPMGSSRTICSPRNIGT